MALNSAVPAMFFLKKIKTFLFLAALAIAACAGAIVAIKLTHDESFFDQLAGREICESISEKISRLRATDGDILELAVLESTLIFEQTDAWTNVPETLGRSVSRVSVPAVFRFYVKISEPVSVETTEENGEILCTIVAPILRPVTPVAFDTSRTTWERNIGALRFNREEMTDSLREKISMRLVLSAKKHAKEPNVRDAARKAFEKFVREWIAEIRALRERPDIKISVKILFADEVPEKPDVPATPEKNPSVPVSI